MNNTKKIMMPFAALAGLALTATSAHAALSVTAVSSGTQNTYYDDVITGDLLSGLTATQVGGNLQGGSLAGLTDDSGGTDTNLGSGAWFTTYPVLTYTLDLTGAADGYDLTSIQSITGWQDNGLFDTQTYTISVSSNQGVEDFVLLANVDTTTSTNPAAYTAGRSSKVNVTEDSSGILASGVKSIRFSILSTNAGGNIADTTLLREIDVEGVATVVPEPSTTALLGLGGLALILRRRK
jgi:hypothetical protein